MHCHRSMVAARLNELSASDRQSAHSAQTAPPAQNAFELERFCGQPTLGAARRFDAGKRKHRRPLPTASEFITGRFVSVTSRLLRRLKRRNSAGQVWHTGIPQWRGSLHAAFPKIHVSTSC